MRILILFLILYGLNIFSIAGASNKPDRFDEVVRRHQAFADRASQENPSSNFSSNYDHVIAKHQERARVMGSELDSMELVLKRNTLEEVLEYEKTIPKPDPKIYDYVPTMEDQIGKSFPDDRLENVVYGEQTGFKEHQTEVGVSTFSYSYEEFVNGDQFIIVEGDNKFGGFVKHTYRPNQENAPMQLFSMYRVEASFNKGDVDYDGGVSDIFGNRVADLDISGEQDTSFEIRGLLGRDYNISHSMVFTPYGGLGYRYLENDPNVDSVFVPSISANVSPYRRESNYYYAPIGFDLTKRHEDFSWTWNSEFDIFLQGRQVSYTNPTVKHDQNSGFGLRSSVKFQKELKNMGVFVEPFFRYWKVEDSEFTPEVDLGGGFFLGSIEPENETKEIGVKAGVVF